MSLRISDDELGRSTERHGADEVARRVALVAAGFCPIHTVNEGNIRAVVAGIHHNRWGDNPVAYCQRHADEREAGGTFTPLDGAR